MNLSKIYKVNNKVNRKIRLMFTIRFHYFEVYEYIYTNRKKIENPAQSVTISAAFYSTVLATTSNFSSTV